MLSLVATSRRNSIVVQRCFLYLNYQAVNELVFDNFYKRYCLFSISEFETEIESYIGVDCPTLALTLALALPIVTLIYVFSNRPRLETDSDASDSDDTSDNTSVDFEIAKNTVCFPIYLDFAIRDGLDRHSVESVSVTTVVKPRVVDRIYLKIYRNRASNFGIKDLQGASYGIANS